MVNNIVDRDEKQLKKPNHKARLLKFTVFLIVNPLCC